MFICTYVLYLQLVFSYFPVFLIRDKDISSYLPACPTTITIGTGGDKVEAGRDKIRECFAGFNDHLLHQGTYLPKNQNCKLQHPQKLQQGIGGTIKLQVDFWQLATSNQTVSSHSVQITVHNVYIVQYDAPVSFMTLYPIQ